MTEYFKLNNIDVGFADHPTEGTFFSKGALNTEVLVRKGKLRISLLTPALEITDEMHNGLLADPWYDNLRHIDYLRMVTYYDLALEDGKYDTQVSCPFTETSTGFEVYNFPESVAFYGTIDVQEGYVHIQGDLKNRIDPSKPGMPIEIRKCFEPKALIPKRKEYTWQEALEADPLEVYDLRIGKGAFEAFPEELLNFKNLESLWVGGQSHWNFETLPEAFFDLEQLHTFQIYGSKIHQLSEKVRQLRNLEELAIESSQLTAVPASLGELPKLDTLSLKYNRLTALPEQICQAPRIKSLTISGNDFRSLPPCLSKIENVEVDRKHQKLYMDLSYVSKNPDPIDESLYDLSRYPEAQKQLETAIGNVPELQKVKDLLLDYSTMATFLIPEEKEDIPLGASKVGGEPDLPRDWEHPANKNGKLYIFHAQLNCRELAPYQAYLPREGMLYFFINDEEYAEKPILLHAPTDEGLHRYEYDEESEFIDSDYDDDVRAAVALSIENAISLPEFYNSYNHGTERYPKYGSIWTDPANEDLQDLLDDYEIMEKLSEQLKKPVGFDNGHIQIDTHALNCSVFTQHESPQEQAAAKFGGEPTEWMVLLKLESLGEFNFWDAGTLSYCIHKKDLAIGDFSTIHASIESS